MTGVFGVIWYVFWVWLSFEKPCLHPTITPSERLYIEESLSHVQRTIPNFYTTPWRAFFTSTPVYAIIVANFCRSWTFYLLILSQPSYFKQVFKFDIGKVSRIILIHLPITFFYEWHYLIKGRNVGCSSSFGHDDRRADRRTIGRSFASQRNSFDDIRP